MASSSTPTLPMIDVAIFGPGGHGVRPVRTWRPTSMGGLPVSSMVLRRAFSLKFPLLLKERPETVIRREI